MTRFSDALHDCLAADVPRWFSRNERAKVARLIDLTYARGVDGFDAHLGDLARGWGVSLGVASRFMAGLENTGFVAVGGAGIGGGERRRIVLHALPLLALGDHAAAPFALPAARRSRGPWQALRRRPVAREAAALAIRDTAALEARVAEVGVRAAYRQMLEGGSAQTCGGPAQTCGGPAQTCGGSAQTWAGSAQTSAGLCYEHSFINQILGKIAPGFLNRFAAEAAALAARSAQTSEGLCRDADDPRARDSVLLPAGAPASARMLSNPSSSKKSYLTYSLLVGRLAYTVSLPLDYPSARNFFMPLKIETNEERKKESFPAKDSPSPQSPPSPPAPAAARPISRRVEDVLSVGRAVVRGGASKGSWQASRDVWDACWGRHVAPLPHATATYPWNARSIGQFQTLNEKLGDQAEPFLAWLLADWTDIVNVAFVWMTRRRPPQFPDIGFVLNFLDDPFLKAFHGQMATRDRKGRMLAGDRTLAAETISRNRGLTLTQAEMILEKSRTDPSEEARQQARKDAAWQAKWASIHDQNHAERAAEKRAQAAVVERVTALIGKVDPVERFRRIIAEEGAVADDESRDDYDRRQSADRVAMARAALAAHTGNGN